MLVNHFLTLVNPQMGMCFLGEIYICVCVFLRDISILHQNKYSQTLKNSYRC